MCTFRGGVRFVFDWAGFVQAIVNSTGASATFTGTITLSGLLARAYTLRVWAIDQAGWRSTSPAITNWRVETAVPEVRIVSRPAPVSGSRKPVIRFAAVSSASNDTVPEATFQVLLLDDPVLGEWHSPVVCNDSLSSSGSGSGSRLGGVDSRCLQSCNGTLCEYSLSLTAAKSYTLQVRAVLGGTVGNTLSSVGWQFFRCSSQQYAVLDENDGIECKPCPVGGDCSSKGTDADGFSSIVQLSDVVAQAGYWASSRSDGSLFYRCPVMAACEAGNPTIVNSVRLYLLFVR
jgi:hypothetical protein